MSLIHRGLPSSLAFSDTTDRVYYTIAASIFQHFNFACENRGIREARAKGGAPACGTWSSDDVNLKTIELFTSSTPHRRQWPKRLEFRTLRSRHGARSWLENETITSQ